MLGFGGGGMMMEDEPTIICTNLLPAGAAGSLSPHTGLNINDMDLGAAAADRQIVFAVCTILAASRTIDTLTLEGSPITTIATDVSVGGTHGARLTWARIPFPTGTSGDLVIGYSGSVGGTVFTAWRVVGCRSQTPHASFVDAVQNTNTCEASIAVPFPGLLIACGMDVGTASDSTPITGVTVQQNLSTGLIGMSYGFLDYPHGGLPTVSFTGNGDAGNTERACGAVSFI